MLRVRTSAEKVSKLLVVAPNWTLQCRKCNAALHSIAKIAGTAHDEMSNIKSKSKFEVLRLVLAYLISSSKFRPEQQQHHHHASPGLQTKLKRASLFW